MPSPGGGSLLLYPKPPLEGKPFFIVGDGPRTSHKRDLWLGGIEGATPYNRKDVFYKFSP